MDFKVSIIQAGHGDCILIQGDFDGQPRSILIDGGPSRAYEYRRRPGALKKALQNISDKGQKIDLLILSHVDDDHIAGLLSGFKNGGLLEQLTEKIWFNSGKLIFESFGKTFDASNLVDFNGNRTDTDASSLTSIGQGVKFEDYISKRGIWQHELIKAGKVIELFGIKFTILSPNSEKLEKLLIKWKREEPSSLTSSANNDYRKSFDELLLNDEFSDDESIHNGSSIAFIFEYSGKRLLFLGDAHNDVITDNIKALGHSEDNPLLLDYVKLSHHGSKYNTSSELLKLISCQNFIISTNGNRHGLPNKLTLARIVDRFPRANLLFNYPELINDIFDQTEQSEMHNQTHTVGNCDQSFTVTTHPLVSRFHPQAPFE